MLQAQPAQLNCHHVSWSRVSRMRSNMRERFYRSAPSYLAFLGAAAAAASAAFAYHHGWAWLNNNTDGSTIEPLNWVNPLLHLAIAWAMAALIAVIGALLLRYSWLGGAIACSVSAAIALAGSVRFGGPITMAATTDAGPANLVLGPVHHWPALAGIMLALPLLASVVIAMMTRHAQRGWVGEPV
jgi:hypothetical protein